MLRERLPKKDVAITPEAYKSLSLNDKMNYDAKLIIKSFFSYLWDVIEELHRRSCNG